MPGHGSVCCTGEFPPENRTNYPSKVRFQHIRKQRWNDHSQIVTKWAYEPISLLQLQHAVCFGRLYRFSRKKGAPEVDYSVKQHLPFQIFKLVTQLCTASLASSPAELVNQANQPSDTTEDRHCMTWCFVSSWQLKAALLSELFNPFTDVRLLTSCQPVRLCLVFTTLRGDSR